MSEWIMSSDTDITANKNSSSKAANIALMGFDVDGVLTDGTLYFTSAGDEMKAFSSLDGHGLATCLQRVGIEVVIISGRRSRALELRAQNLGIDCTCTWAWKISAA
jgi:3-deoxy-D-manno-octulosonate 8-phosphate phosphatase (KDO 8-P phosphatase)